MDDRVPPSFIPAKDNSKKWYFSAEELAKVPSILNGGFDKDKELRYRQQAAGFVQEMGEKLNHNIKDARARISQLCLCTAMVYMHRFYVFHSFTIFDPRDAAAAALFLAAKVEECPRKLEHIVKVWHMLKHPNEAQVLDTKSEQYMAAAQLIMTYENVFLQTIAFDLEVQTPHVFVIKHCQIIMKGNRDLAEAAYWFASDILHLTNFCIRYRPSVVACVCIYLACSWANWEIPVSQEGKKWFQYQDAEVTDKLLRSLGEEFVAIMHKCGNRLKLKGSAYLGKKVQALAEGNHLNSPGASTSSVPGFTSPPHGAGALVAGGPQGGAPTKQDHGMGQQMGSPNKTNQAALKRIKTEPAVLDLKSYKERRPINEPQAELSSSISSTSNVGGERKSFLPDMSQHALKKVEYQGGPGVTNQGSQGGKEERRERKREKERGSHPKDPHRHHPSTANQQRPSSSSANKRPIPEGGHAPHIDTPMPKHRRPEGDQQHKMRPGSSAGKTLLPDGREGKPGHPGYHRDGRPRSRDELKPRPQSQPGMPSLPQVNIPPQPLINEDLDREIRGGLGHRPPLSSSSNGSGEVAYGRPIPSQPPMGLQGQPRPDRSGMNRGQMGSSHHPLLPFTGKTLDQRSSSDVAKDLQVGSAKKTDAHNKSFRDQFYSRPPPAPSSFSGEVPPPRREAPLANGVEKSSRGISSSSSSSRSNEQQRLSDAALIVGNIEIPPPPQAPTMQQQPMDLEEGELSSDDEEPPLPSDAPPRNPPPPK